MAKRIPVRPRTGVRDAYAAQGVEGYYAQHAADYHNPHERQVRELLKRNRGRFDCSHVLDLACGGGEVTLALGLEKDHVVGADPYTCALYAQKTGARCVPCSFDDILRGKLEGRFSAVICSYGLHLLEESKLPAMVKRLLLLSDTIVIVTPHKRPQLERYGLRKVHEDAALTDKGKKVFLRIYR